MIDISRLFNGRDLEVKNNFTAKPYSVAESNCSKYGDRLPTIEELQTLINWSKSPPIYSEFNLKETRYWSSTSTTLKAQTVQFETGKSQNSYKNRDESNWICIKKGY